MNLAMDLGRDESPASYVRSRQHELRGARGLAAVLGAVIETATALEDGDPGRARRAWRVVLESAEREGRAARRAGLGTRELVARIGRVRDEVDLVLFDGRLPPDLAARAARLASKMSGHFLDRVLAGYWIGGAPCARSSMSEIRS